MSEWTLPPEDQREDGFRCIVMIELEWVKGKGPGQHDAFFMPRDHSAYILNEKHPGFRGALPLPK